jgi:hypothetical protein
MVEPKRSKIAVTSAAQAGKSAIPVIHHLSSHEKLGKSQHANEAEHGDDQRFEIQICAGADAECQHQQHRVDRQSFLPATQSSLAYLSRSRQASSVHNGLDAVISGPSGLGLIIYLLFGRDRKAFSRESELVRQNLQANAVPLLGTLYERQDEQISRLERQGPVPHRLMQLVRRNSHSALTVNNRVAIQQDASIHYPSLIADLKAARYAIYLQYYIWADDPFTQELKTILVEAAARGGEVRILYDPIGSVSKLSNRYKRELTSGASISRQHRRYGVFIPCHTAITARSP